MSPLAWLTLEPLRSPHELLLLLLLCEVDHRLIVRDHRLSVWTPACSASVQATEDISKTLTQVKAILYGEGGAFRRLTHCHSLVRDGPRGVSSASSPKLTCFVLSRTRCSLSTCAETAPQPELVAQLAQESYSNDLFHLLVTNMWRFEFEVGSPRGPAMAALGRLTMPTMRAS